MKQIYYLLFTGFVLFSCKTISKETILAIPQISNVVSNTNASFRGIAVYDDQNIWVSGTKGTVLHSTNGGTDWEALQLPEADSLDFRDIEILDKNTVLLMSIGNGNQSRIYKTTNGGKDWRIVFTNTDENAFFDGIDFWDAQNGLLISDPIDGRLLLLKTEDGGENWYRVGAETLPNLKEVEYGFAASGTGIVTKDGNKAWIATGGEVARVFYSSDGGQSWAVVSTPIYSGNTSSGIFSLDFRDSQNGVAVGGDYQNPKTDLGNVAYTTDGGQSWTLVKNDPPVFHKACVQYLGQEEYLAVGRTGVAWSQDDGRHWQELSQEGYFTFSFDPKSRVGFMAGSKGRIAKLNFKKN